MTTSPRARPAGEPDPPTGAALRALAASVARDSPDPDARRLARMMLDAVDDDEMVPLGAVDCALSYEAARTACKKGLVLSEKRGGRVFVDAGDLVRYAGRSRRRTR